jgi:acylpyruvate hydrolase
MDSHILRLLNSNKIFALAWNWTPSKSPISNPVIFQKPVSSIIPTNSKVKLPSSEILLHESKNYLVELGFYISKKASNINESEAFEYVEGYCLALDMTSSSILDKHKIHGLSWDIGKGLDTFLPLSSFIPKDQVPDPTLLTLELSVNSIIKQKGYLKDMRHNIPSILNYLSSLFTLNPGDLILTGTPPGASPVSPGDNLHGKLKNQNELLLELKTLIV